MELTYVFNIGPLLKLSPLLKTLVSEVVMKTAFLIEGDAKMLAPVDTGALRASIYTVTTLGSTQPQAWAEAESLYKTKRPNDKVPFDPIVDDIPVDGLTAVVAVGMEYGKYQEMGTAHHAAQPFMTPAMEMHRAYFYKGIEQALATAARGAGWTP